MLDTVKEMTCQKAFERWRGWQFTSAKWEKRACFATKTATKIPKNATLETKKPLQINDLQRRSDTGGVDGRFRNNRANPVFMRVSSRFTLQGHFKRMAHSNGQVSHYCSARFESRFDIRTSDHVALKMGVNGRFIGFNRGLGAYLR